MMRLPQLLQEMETLSHSDHYTFRYHAGLRLGRIEFLRKPSTPEYRAAVTLFIDLLLQGELELMLFHNLQAGLISPDEQAWSRFYIEQVLTRSRLRKLASVIGGDYIQKLLISNMHRGTPSPYQMGYFEAEEQALEWLLEGNMSPHAEPAP